MNRSRSPSFLSFTAILLALAAPAESAAVTLGQIDRFDAGVENWFGGGGGGGAPAWISTGAGGPAGAGDAYMRWSAMGNPLGGKNESQWTGDFLGAGVSAIEVDVNNFGDATLELRVILWHSSDLIAWTSLDPVIVSPMSGWQHLQFGIRPNDLGNALLNAPDMAPFNTPEFALSDVLRVLIRHDPGTPNAVGESAGIALGSPLGPAYTVGVDNIEAAVIPEPGGGFLVVLSGLAFLVGGTRRRRVVVNG